MDHIEIDLKEIWLEALYWIQVAQNSSVANPCEHCNEPSVGPDKRVIVRVLRVNVFHRII
jgi:hypothetical protein